MIQKLHVSKNLFDKDNATVYDCYVTTNGQWAAGTGNKTVRISCSSNTQYTLSTASTYAAFRIMETGSDNIPSDGSPVSGTLIYYGSGNSYAFTTSNTAKYIIFQANATSLNQWLSELMLNTGQTALPYEPYGDTWNTKSYAKIVDTTQQVTSFPVVVRPMENTIPSWTIKGNLVQDGTPFPSNIIYPSETGDRTANLLTTNGAQSGYITADGTVISGHDNLMYTDYIAIPDGVTYITQSYGGSLTAMNAPALCFYDSAKTYITGEAFGNVYDKTFTVPNDAVYIRTCYRTTMSWIMLNTGSTALPYQPYGYKLDIKSGNTTTPVYLGQVQSTRKIKKYEITGLEGWITRAGTPENVFFCERQGVNFINNAAICSHYANQDSGSFDDLQDKHFIVKIASSGDKTYFGIRDSSYPSTNEGATQLRSYLQQQYANGTPVTVWYVLATPTTTTLNEPLRKIGTYSDLVSGTNLSVTAQSPTTIDVDTSLKPSEMGLTYTWKKMCGRKKYVHGNSPQVMPSATAETKELNGITITCDGKGTYTVSGTATAYTEISFIIPEFTIPISVGQGGNGTLSFFNTVYNANNRIVIKFMNGDDLVDGWSLNTPNRTHTSYSILGGKLCNKIILSVAKSEVCEGKFAIMFTDDGQLPVTYQPYLQWQ